MKELTNENEIEQYRDELFAERVREQKSKKDFAFDEAGNIEHCSDCNSPINSHGHCPRCDY